MYRAAVSFCGSSGKKRNINKAAEYRAPAQSAGTAALTAVFRLSSRVVTETEKECVFYGCMSKMRISE